MLLLNKYTFKRIITIFINPFLKRTIWPLDYPTVSEEHALISHNAVQKPVGVLVTMLKQKKKKESVIPFVIEAVQHIKQRKNKTEYKEKAAQKHFMIDSQII
jgi:hypothetical protein